MPKQYFLEQKGRRQTEYLEDRKDYPFNHKVFYLLSVEIAKERVTTDTSHYTPFSVYFLFLYELRKKRTGICFGFPNPTPFLSWLSHRSQNISHGVVSKY